MDRREVPRSMPLVRIDESVRLADESAPGPTRVVLGFAPWDHVSQAQDCGIREYEAGPPSLAPDNGMADALRRGRVRHEVARASHAAPRRDRHRVACGRLAGHL